MVTAAVHTYIHVCLQAYIILVFMDFHISGISGFLEITKFQKYGNTRNMKIWKFKSINKSTYLPTCV